MSKLFIGSLSWNTDSDGLREAFCHFGEITDSFVCRDRETGRSRGFGFITYASEADAQKAIADMNGFELDGRSIKVDKASERSSGGGNGGGFGGRREGGGYGGRREGGGGYGGRSEGGYGGRSEGGYGGRSEGGYGGGRSNGGGYGGY